MAIDAIERGATDRPTREVFICTTAKGGAGKTETADLLDGVFALAGNDPILVDVDDGNRGLLRRVGKENVLPIPWTYGPSDAPAWVASLGTSNRPIVFDLGAGISSSDTPIMAFLDVVWRMLFDQSAQIHVLAIVSTNARCGNYIDALHYRYGKIANIVIVRNNQDGSRNFPAELVDGPERSLEVSYLTPGIQAVRLRESRRLSDLVRRPDLGYVLATSMIANRVADFADHLKKASILDEADHRNVVSYRQTVAQGFYIISSLARATDRAIHCNQQLEACHRKVLRADLGEEDAVALIEAYRAAMADHLAVIR